MSDELLVLLIVFALGLVLAVTFLCVLTTAMDVITAIREGDVRKAILNFVILVCMFAMFSFTVLLFHAEAVEETASRKSHKPFLEVGK